MSWLRRIWLLMLVLGTVVSPRLASARAPLGLETRAGGIDLAAQVIVGVHGLASPGSYLGNPDGYDEDASGCFLAARGTGTVWDAVAATQPVYEGTVIPRSFELATGSDRVWVHGNATEHMAEYATSMLGRGVGRDLVNLGSQQQIRSLQAAVESATAGGVPYGQLVNVGGWELKFPAPRAADQLPALIHALPR